MCERDKTKEHEDPLKRLLREHRERMAVIRDTKFEVEPYPGLQSLVDSQDEFREEMLTRLRRLLSG